jgi:Ser/Thr protein kinase RdoA (MazF antagonist)
VESKPLSGGLEASEVTLVTVRYRDDAGRPQMFRAVLKELSGWTVREAVIYECLARRHAGGMSPRLLAVDRSAPNRAVICIEAVRRTRAWPWRDLTAADELLARLARFHIAARSAAAALPAWDYENELSTLAEDTWAAVDRCRYHPDLQGLARGLPAVKRIALARPRLRRQLLSEFPFGSGPIHGDVHPGNALVRRRGRGDEPLLLDWARARVGSPLEDVSSWLQSLGYWEGEARRYHDRLLGGYLSSFGLERKLTSGIRAAYWMAGASNAFAGALLHHVCVAEDERLTAPRRAAAHQAARDWLRVIRRADAWWS